MADNTLPNEQERLPEPQRQPKLLHHLRTGQLVDVPPGLLKDPWSSTRPFVGLVADCDKVRQVFLRSLSKGQVIGSLVAIGTLATLLEVNLAELWTTIVNLLELVLASAVPGLGGVVQVVPTLVNALGAALLVYYAMNLTGQVSNRRNTLVLDLNGLYHDSPSGPLNVSWRNVLAVAPGRTRWLRVWLEDGGVLYLRVPEADRDWLVDVIKQLLRHHHQDLYGTFPDPEAPCPTPTEPQPELPESRHGRPQLRDRYTAFVAERDQVFAAMPDDMTDADKQREFAEFLRWQDIRSR